ncbi:MAG TPA: DUF4388 domain-containing protein [bacterium]|nr:DUF4388 domain-containing protein [bacterium]
MGLEHLNSETIDRGRLSEHAAVELLGLLFANRRTGILVIRQGRVEIKIYAFNGIPIFAETTSPGNSMIEVMAKDRMLNHDDVLQIKQLAEEKNIPIEECIQMVHEITLSQLYYYQVQAAKEIIIKACGYKEGNYAFQDSEDVLNGIAMYDLNPLEIIYEGMRRYHIHDLAADIFAVENRKLRLNPGIKDYFLLPGPLYEHSHVLDIFLRETPVAGAIALLQDEFKDINQAIYLLYLLIVTGLLEFVREIPQEEIIEDTPSLKEPPLPEAILETADVLEIEEICLSEDKGTMDCDTFVPENESGDFAPTNLGRSTAPPPDKTAAPPGPASQSHHSSSMYASARGTREHVGIGKAPAKRRAAKPAPAPEAEPKAPGRPAEDFRREVVRPAGAKPKKKQPAPAPAPVLSTAQKGRISREFALLQKQLDEAKTLYDVLEVTVDDGTSELNEAYTKKKKIISPDGTSGALPGDLDERAAALAAKLDEAYQTLVNPERRIEYEREMFDDEKKRAWNLGFKKSLAKKMETRGHWYMRQNAPQYARECFKQAVDLDPEYGEYYMDLGWAIFRSQPEKAAEARGYLHSALKVDPKLDMAPYYLGVIAKREEDNNEAESYFRMALEINADNASAARELAFLTQRQKQKGILNKIFGR